MKDTLFPRRRKALSCLNDSDRLYFPGKPWVSSWSIVPKLSCSTRPFVCGKETQIERAEPITFYHCKSGATEMFDNALKRNGCTWDAFLGESLQYGATTRLDFSTDLPVHTDLLSLLQWGTEVNSGSCVFCKGKKMMSLQTELCAKISESCIFGQEDSCLTFAIFSNYCFCPKLVFSPFVLLKQGTECSWVLTLLLWTFSALLLNIQMPAMSHHCHGRWHHKENTSAEQNAWAL